MSEKSVSNQPVAVITGASRGLGLALTRKFLEKGWKVYALSRTRRHWSAAKKSFPANAKVFFHAFDLTSEPSVKRFVQKLKKERVALLINNAGYGGDLIRIEDTSVKEYHKLMDSNLLSVFLMCKYFVPVFRLQKKGFILNISSMAGQRAVPKLSVYSAAKFGVLAITQAVAKENLDIPIKAVTVCPGGMNTEMRAKIFGKEDASRQQSTDFVADTILDVCEGKISVESGGDIVIRHGKITAIHPCPGI